MSVKYAQVAEYQYRNNGAITSKRVRLWSRECYQFLCACRKMSAEIHRQILAVYSEECCMSKSMMCRWFAGKRFDTTEEISTVVVEYFQNLEGEYCYAGLQKFHKRYTKCLDLQGDYVEK